MVLAAETSAQETATAQDSAAILIKDVEDQVPLPEREAWERVLRVEAESIMTLAFAHNKVEGLVWKIAFLEGELAEAHRDREMAEENSHGLSNAVADAERWKEESEREHQEQFEELTLL
jgi:hypothetical protein